MFACIMLIRCQRMGCNIFQSVLQPLRSNRSPSYVVRAMAGFAFKRYKLPVIYVENVYLALFVLTEGTDGSCRYPVMQSSSNPRRCS